METDQLLRRQKERDRLVALKKAKKKLILGKGLRAAQAQTLEQANGDLDNEFLPWWNQTLTVRPGWANDAQRPLGKAHSLAATLSDVETRQVANHSTIGFENRRYQIARARVWAGRRGGPVRGKSAATVRWPYASAILI